jgi:hypothetical protein
MAAAGGWRRMKTKKEKKHAKEVAEDNRPCAGCAELRKQNAGYARTIHGLQEQLAEARKKTVIEITYGQSEDDGTWVPDWRYTRDEEIRTAAARREKLLEELAALDAKLEPKKVSAKHSSIEATRE